MRDSLGVARSHRKSRGVGRPRCERGVLLFLLGLDVKVLCREASGPGVNLSITTDDLRLDRHGGRVERAHPTPPLKVHPQHRTVGEPVVPSARRCAHWTIPIGVAAAPVSRSYIDRRRAATPSSLSLKLLTNNSYAPDASGLAGPVPGPLYDAAVAKLGQEGFDAVIFITIHYLALGVMLNAYDVPVGRPVSQQ